MPDWFTPVIEQVLNDETAYSEYPYMEFTDPGDPLLLSASLAAADGLELTKRMIDRGCNINLRDKRGLAAIHESILTHNQKALELLIDKGADVNQPVYSKRYFELSNNIVYDNNLTPLHLMLYLTQENPSSLDEHKDEILMMLNTLMDAGARRKAMLKESGKTALDVAIDIGDQEIIDLLKE